MSKKEPKFGEDCSGCLHGICSEWCGRCRLTIYGTPSCYLHCSMTNGNITPIKEFCKQCTNDKKCGCDSGFRDECIYNGTGVPSEFRPEGVRESMEQAVRPSKREEILREAIKCVCTDRNQQYGEPEDNFNVIAELWIPYIKARCVLPGVSVDITPGDVCNMMALFKIGRAATAETQKKDTYIDIAGYAACAGGMIE